MDPCSAQFVDFRKCNMFTKLNLYPYRGRKNKRKYSNHLDVLIKMLRFINSFHNFRRERMNCVQQNDICGRDHFKFVSKLVDYFRIRKKYLHMPKYFFFKLRFVKLRENFWNFSMLSRSNVDWPIKIRLDNLNKSSAHKINISSIGNNEEKIKIIVDDLPTKQKSHKCTKSTQTDYRDSEAQTDPWIPPYDERLNSLLFLKPGR